MQRTRPYFWTGFFNLKKCVKMKIEKFKKSKEFEVKSSPKELPNKLYNVKIETRGSI